MAGKKMRPEDHTLKTSKFSSWLQDLIALDEVRKRTHQLFIDMNGNPYLCPSVIDAMYEMYRIMRPLCDKQTKEIMAERFEEIREDAEKFVARSKQDEVTDPYQNVMVPSDVRWGMSWLFDLIYDLRHDLKLGTKTSDKPADTLEVLKRSADI